MKMLRFTYLFSTLLILAACNTLQDEPNHHDLRITSAPQVTLHEGNPTCKDLLGDDYIELKVEPVIDGTYSDGYLTATIVVTDTAAGPTFSFTTDRTVDAVFAKGGSAGNLYDYRPSGTTGDSGLHAPVNASGKYAGLSHISFCYQLRLDVSKTAETSVKRTWTWQIDKSGEAGPIILAPGQSYFANYSITVSASSQDTERTVSGVITATNNTGVEATVTSVSDLLGNIAVTPECGVSFPYTLGAGESLNCTYSYTNDDKTKLPDTGTNTATVTTTGTVKGATATANWDFANKTLSAEIDECIDLTDTLYGTLGTVCAEDLSGSSKTFTYTLDLAQYAKECGETAVTNTAKLTTNDTGTKKSDSHSVSVTVECVKGCTLTQGYWKTHSTYGPAPYDDTWSQLGEDTPFFASGKTYYQVLWTAPRGSVYYILAHQYIAAVLNGLNGADTSAISADLTKAKTFFETYTPASSLTKTQQAEFKALASRLDAYNNGVTGPGHCSEDKSSG